jgi:hypothetical protein
MAKKITRLRRPGSSRKGSDSERATGAQQSAKILLGSLSRHIGFRKAHKYIEKLRGGEIFGYTLTLATGAETRFVILPDGFLSLGEREKLKAAWANSEIFTLSEYGAFLRENPHLRGVMRKQTKKKL